MLVTVALVSTAAGLGVAGASLPGPSALTQAVCAVPRLGRARCQAVLLVDTTRWRGAAPTTSADLPGQPTLPPLPTPPPLTLPTLPNLLGPGATTTSTASTSSTTSTTSPAQAAHNGYGPADLQAAYALSSATATATGAGQTIAVVEGGGDPNGEADLAVYRSSYGLPPCTVASGCLTKVDQNGGTTYPAADDSWAAEESVDLQVASATCPNCSLLVVEARSSALSDLNAAQAQAVAKGATVINDSYAYPQYDADAASDAPYDHPGIPVVAAAGENVGSTGYGNTTFPANSGKVTAVGATTLKRSTDARGFTESAWTSSVSGCSGAYAQPAWQHDSGCNGQRTDVDVAAVGDPATGVAVYDSVGLVDRSGTRHRGWLVFGGTSVASVVVAGAYALAGNGKDVGPGASGLYAAPVHAFFDVTSGTNGTCPAGAAYLCNAGPGYDGPTGLGTPNGIGAF